MAKYKAIHGFTVQNRTADTDPLNIGQVYYRSDTGDMKVTLNVLGTGSWASGGNLNTAGAFGGGFGTQTAAVYATRYSPAGQQGIVESYNGSAWSEVNDVNTARRELGSFGTQTAGLICGGRPPTIANTELYNGTNWTEVNDMNTARSEAQSNWGTQTSGVFATGYTTTNVANAETWDGTSWTEVADVNTARQYAAGIGDNNTSGLCVGGSESLTNVESWNGTSWTETTEINTGRGTLGGAGVATLGIVYGGSAPSPSPTSRALTEEWNGSSWTEVADMATARYSPGSAKNGSTIAALAFGGVVPPYSNATEEFTVPQTATNSTITD